MEWIINKIEQNPAILISAYAALISTIALTWNIVNSILDKIDRISVKAVFYTTMVFDNNGELIQGPQLLEISVVNMTKRVKYIKVPQIKLNYNHGWNMKGNDRKNQIVNLYLKGSKTTYPLEIKPESEVTLKYPFSNGNEWVYENSRKNSKFRVVITDTIDKKYKSKKIKVENLKKCMEHNLRINPQLISEIIINN